MAWQLHYTSAAGGPDGRAGFQVVAASPGLPPGLAGQVAARLAYRPPPGAPLAPTGEQLADFPVALAYEVLDGRWCLLTRCVYLGRDYSGRYGNFLGHAVVAEADELTGLRPVEMWRSPLWAAEPAPPGTELAELDDLPPGDGTDPESLAGWLAAGGEPAYRRLALLLDAVGGVLARGHGRVVLVSAEVEEIVRWLAVVSFSLPWPAAARLAFATYSGDPAAAAQPLVGTTPDCWLPAGTDDEVVRLAEPHPPGPPPGRFARTTADCWRQLDLAGLDALGELAALPAPDGGRAAPGPDTWAALLAFCRGDPSVTAAEEAAVARALRADLPGEVWDDLAAAAGRMGYELASAARAVAPPGADDAYAARCAVLALRDTGLPAPAPARSAEVRARLGAEADRALAAAGDLGELAAVLRTARAVHAPVDAGLLASATRALVRAGRGDLGRLLDTVPDEARAAVLAGAVPGLEEAPDHVRDGLPAAAVRRLAGADLSAAPRTALSLVLAQVRHGLLGRPAATARLLDLAAATATKGPAAGPGITAGNRPLWPGRTPDTTGGTPGELAGVPGPGPAPDTTGKSPGEPTGRRERANRDVRADQDEVMGADVTGVPGPGATPDPAGDSPGTTSGAPGPDGIPDPAGDAPGAAGGREPGETLDAALEEVWREPPAPAECAELVELLGAALDVSPRLRDLPARAFRAAGVADPGCVRLAKRVAALVPGYPARDAEAVLLAAALPAAASAAEAAELLARLYALEREADEEVSREAATLAARTLAGEAPARRADVAGALPDAGRARLAGDWLAAAGTREEAGALLEVALLLHLAGVPLPAELAGWARSRLSGPFGRPPAWARRDERLAAAARELARGEGAVHPEAR
ncbi:hypothetical protein Sru01_09600 [Sphaerisporangium rufum]|uniref:Uncharacterized protein n=1 Tax=Sphaerisporangium rufum TaxID=1381558 RepID=A0A919QY44_9ACTN|nr:hypothetical protein [Sphaerisporangium rufum]GII75978.1 hypothetical protein Sru01_09600 [Sphaerisporangium rufum]